MTRQAKKSKVSAAPRGPSKGAEENPTRIFPRLSVKAYSVIFRLHWVLNQLLTNTVKLQKEHDDLRGDVAHMYNKGGKKRRH